MCEISAASVPLPHFSTTDRIWQFLTELPGLQRKKPGDKPGLSESMVLKEVVFMTLLIVSILAILVIAEITIRVRFR